MSNRSWLFVWLAAAVLTLGSCTSKKTGYVDMFKLVSEFELQLEYTKQFKVEVDRQKQMIDSLVYAQKLRDPVSADQLKNALYQKLNMETEKTNVEIEKMLWTRLNPFIEDFGRERGYSYIYGANGTGNVLYASPDLDITDELIEYVNKRYYDHR